MSRTLLICILLFMASLALFSYNIEHPKQLLFDETAYIPPARQFLALQDVDNKAHPPLAKELIAVGIHMFGDHPLGWRFMSAVFGALTVVGMFVWASALFVSTTLGGWVALVTLCNQFLYVQARIGMLDTFMMCFIVWALAFVTVSFRSSSRAFSLLSCAGIALGLATACKWFGVVAWGLVVFWIAMIRWREWPEWQAWRQLRTWQWIWALAILPIIFYFVTFVPMLFLKTPQPLGVWDLVKLQRSMWYEQRLILSAHSYMSRWPSWPFLIRPIWYLFEPEGLFARCVLLIGNPFVMWTGLVALLGCVWGFVVHRHRDAFFALTAYVFFYFSWAVIPKVITFHYYYYPAACSLSMALAYVFSRRAQRLKWIYLAVAFGMFVYFYPISSSILIPVHSYNHWMWFRNWR